mmetsp:Transcript_157363/g.293575  ORF Transcript_157363/g.293575 Transcript_157363/m.293575 type:complete len:85 (+) Transcript_157363:429-683(+)
MDSVETKSDVLHELELVDAIASSCDCEWPAPAPRVERSEEWEVRVDLLFALSVSMHSSARDVNLVGSQSLGARRCVTQWTRFEM